MARKRTPDQIAKKLMDGNTDNKFADNFRKNINVGGKDGTIMEDFRKLGMGFRDDIDSAKRLKFKAVTAEYNIEASDNLITANGTFSVFLPTATGIIGKEYNIKNVGVGIITLDGKDSETIDGSTTAPMIANLTLTVVSDGANWIII